MAKKNSILLYIDNYTPAIGKLSFEQKGRLFDAIFCKAGAEHAEEPELDALLEMAFDPISTAMNRAHEKYEKVCERNRKNGKKGGRPKGKPKKPSRFSGNPKKPHEPKKPDSDSDSDSDSEPDNDISLDGEDNQNDKPTENNPEVNTRSTGQANSKPSPKKKKTPLQQVKNMRLDWWTVEQWDELISIRRQRKAAITQRAFKLLIKQLDLAHDNGESAESILDDLSKYGWKGYEWEWVENRRAKNLSTRSPGQPNGHQDHLQPRNMREAIAIRNNAISEKYAEGWLDEIAKEDSIRAGNNMGVGTPGTDLIKQ